VLAGQGHQLRMTLWLPRQRILAAAAADAAAAIAY